jgi:glycosyltransferase involved in cell wall biosynthesis
MRSAFRIFAGIREKRPDARFLVIGPDGGEQQGLQHLVHGLGLDGCVEFFGSMMREQIFATVAEASFYLGTSRYEGMAMSVVEAMQLGLVPVVRPVGEIARYCVHGVNALFIRSEEEAVEDVLALLADADTYARLRQSAVSTWKRRPLYSQSMIAAVNQLLGVGDHLNGLDQVGRD